MLKRIIVCLAALLVIGAALLVYTPPYIADSLYKNVDDISDGEMPPTVTSFQSGPDVVSTIGGSGEGLNCSLPKFANVLFDGSKDANGKHHLVLQRFRQACVFHDLCYRHGLATYGYNQSDCDRTLQNEAFRLCQYIRNGTKESSASRCQTDSKMVLAGVSIGGSDAYRAWDRSTYFEFQSDPYRSNGFVVSRVVDHPFKSIDRNKYHDDPDQVILTFENIRSNLKVTCVNCASTAIINDRGDPNDVSPELKSLGIAKLPDTLLTRHDKHLSATLPVWLPPRRRHAAPHLLVDSTGKHNLIWVSRNNPQDTISCLIIADAARLLTNTLPLQDFCARGARSSLTMVEVDIFATSPLPMEVPLAQERIYATGISAQKTLDHSLSLCSRSASRTVDYADPTHDDQAKCVTLLDPAISKGSGLGAFQNFAVIRPGQQIYFARDVQQRDDSFLRAAWQRIWGDTYSSHGVMLVLDLKPPTTTKGPLNSEIQNIKQFDIDDRFDPMMPMTARKDDFRFLSLEASGAHVFVRSIDFQREVPTVENVALQINADAVELHRSWGLRPVLVLETREAQPKTKLVFSRAEIEANTDSEEEPASNSERLTLETLVFERDATAPPDAPFVQSAGATCSVEYSFHPRPDFPCSRTFDSRRPMRSSPASQMQASQLLVGRFTNAEGYGVAFPDSCVKNRPIILQPSGRTFLPMKESQQANGVTRKVTCKDFDSPSIIRASVGAKGAASGLSRVE